MTEKEFLHWLADEGLGARVQFDELCESKPLTYQYVNNKFICIDSIDHYSGRASKYINNKYNVKDLTFILDMMGLDTGFKTLPKLHKKTIEVWGRDSGSFADHEALSRALGLNHYWMNEEKSAPNQKKFKITIEELEEEGAL